MRAVLLHSLAHGLTAAGVYTGSSTDSSIDKDRHVQQVAWRALFGRFGGVNGGGGGRGVVESLEVVYVLLQQPFTDVRVACFDLLRAVAQQRVEEEEDGGWWGVRTIQQHGALLPYLLDRSTEAGGAGGSSTKEDKEWKFAVVDTLMRCPQVWYAVYSVKWTRS
jgi:hypothetical protein